MFEERIEQDIKTALLARDSQKVSVLRGLKSELLNLKVATGARETGLSDEDVLKVLAKQSKQRQESADLYKQGGDQNRYDAELAEKSIIDAYLPEQLSEEKIKTLIDEVIEQTGASGPQAMGQVIGQVKQKAGAAAEGSVIARLVKEKLV
jgi:uncharacterized protein YqeY